MKRLFCLIAALAVVLCIPAYAESESVLDYIRSLGYTVRDSGTEGDGFCRCLLVENATLQELDFSENGNSYYVAVLPEYQQRYDPAMIYGLFMDLVSRFDWDISFYWPEYSEDGDPNIVVSYGITRDLQHTAANYMDKSEYLEALAATLAVDAPARASVEVGTDFDLSALSFDDLTAFKEQINLAMWSSEEWQEVTVPQGIWVVGEDIPAGKWTVKCADIGRDNAFMKFTLVIWGESLDDDGSISYKGAHGDDIVYNPNSKYYEEGSITEITLDLLEGQYVQVYNTNAPAVFMPYTGKPSLGFK